MGKGMELARGDAPEHVGVLENFRDQLLIVLMKRLAVDGKVSIPVAECDDTGQDLLSFRIEGDVFHFELSRKS